MKSLILSGLFIALSACQPGLDHQNKVSPRALFEKPSDIRLAPAGTEEFALTRTPETRPPLTRALLERGHQRYDIYCAVCHGFAGGGNGLAINRGFPAPKPFTVDGDSTASIYQTIRNGKGAMSGFASHIPPSDAWAIADFVQALKRRKP